MNLPRFYHTVKYLKPIQIRYQIKYRLFSLSRELKKLNHPLPDNVTPEPLILDKYIDKPESFHQYYTFRFLNQEIKFEKNKINWEESRYGKLWAYNLNYMDYLLQSSMTQNTGLDLIGRFIQSLPHNLTGIEPYPTSLRGINWIKFLSRYNVNDKTINTSLYNQYQILTSRLEYHLLGNHLLENAFSLLLGAFYFNDIDLYKKSKQILEEELNEQILEDGGHFELSPMYHQIILDRLLDTINLLKNNERFKDQEELLNFLVKIANKMIQWLQRMTFSNGDIPLFNDSAIGIAPTSSQLFHYAQRLSSGLPLLNPAAFQTSKLSDSGYRRFNSENYECIVDAGQIGPDYIPGHAHADMLSFVLYVKGKPVVIDSGISTYEKNEQRQLERSTVFHNTVVMNDKNQSDVWGGFRVGRRATVKILKDESNEVIAEHNGYHPIIHTRSFKFKQDQIIIKDNLSQKSENAKAFSHFSPKVDFEIQNNMLFLTNLNIKIVFNKANKIFENKFFCPQGYNKFTESKQVIIYFDKQLETIIQLKSLKD